MTPIDPALVERMAALLRDMHQRAPQDGLFRWSKDLAAIVAELPEPVDPDLVFVREVYADIREARYPEIAEQIRRGKFDRDLPVTVALAALRRGKELALS